MKKLLSFKRASMEARILPVIALFFLIIGIPYVVSAHSIYTTEYVFVIVLGFFMIAIRAIAIINIRNKYVDIVLTILTSVIASVNLIVFGFFTLLIIFIYPKLRYKIVYAFAVVEVFVLGVNLIFEGLRPSKNEQHIMVFNHGSFIDDLLSAIAIGCRPWTILFDERIRRIPFFSVLLRKYAVPVNRDDKFSRMAAYRKLTKEVKDGKSVVIFPEGKRLRPEDFENGILLNEFQKGAISIACGSELPIYPVVFVLPFLYKPRSGKWWFSPRTIKIIYCPKVISKGKSIEQVTKEVFDVMNQTLIENVKRR